MIGIVVVTHGKLAEEFLSALEHIVGRQDQTEAICIGPEDDMECRRTDIQAAAGRVDSGDGVVLLTDMFGGTPSNLSISLLEAGRLEVIAGLNLPLLVKLAELRDRAPMADAVAQAKDAGRKYIHVASQLLGGEPGEGAP